MQKGKPTTNTNKAAFFTLYLVTLDGTFIHSQSRQYIASMLHELIQINNRATTSSLFLKEHLQLP